MSINYEDIGKRIRRERENKNITQEKLAELADISIQHLCNIENSNTKLSLPVLIDIANAMNTNASIFLLGSLENNSISANCIIADLLLDCTKEEKIIIIDTIQSLKDSLKKNRKEV